MTPVEKEIVRLRRLVHADPPPPKLMWDNYKEQMNDQCMEAMHKLEYWRQELGADTPAYLRFLKSTLDKEAFLDHIEEKVEEVVTELRSYGPRPPPSLEENWITEARAVGATALEFLLETLEADGRRHKATPFRAEFLSELKRVEEAVALFKEQEDDEADGWHKPPGFEKVDSPKKAEAPPPPPKKKEIRLEKELPGMKDAESLDMLLHGVSFEDVHRHGMILLLEMCGDIIAEECNIPRDCITNLAFHNHGKAAEEPEEESPKHGRDSDDLEEAQEEIDRPPDDA